MCARIECGLSQREFLAHSLGQVVDLLNHRRIIRRIECDFPLARIELLLTNINRDTKNHPEPYQMTEIRPDLVAPAAEPIETPESIEDARRASAKEQLRIARSMALQLGGSVELPDGLK